MNDVGATILYAQTFVQSLATIARGLDIERERAMF
jgi:hypothetical protein